MAKLQKEKAYKYKDHHIYRYRLNITPEIVDELGWDDGMELELKVKNNKLEVTKIDQILKDATRSNQDAKH